MNEYRLQDLEEDRSRQDVENKLKDRWWKAKIAGLNGREYGWLVIPAIENVFFFRNKINRYPTVRAEGRVYVNVVPSLHKGKWGYVVTQGRFYSIPNCWMSLIATLSIRAKENVGSLTVAPFLTELNAPSSAGQIFDAWVPASGDAEVLNEIIYLNDQAMHFPARETDRDITDCLATNSSRGQQWTMLTDLFKALNPPSPADRMFELPGQALAAPVLRPKVQSLAPVCKDPVMPVERKNFGVNEKQISVYIDESWPDDDNRKETGIIAGVVWLGANMDEDVLPWIATHIRDVPVAEEHLRRLWACPRCLPFIFPITWGDGANAEEEKPYGKLIQQAMKLLLGWILPPSSQTATVSFFMEQYLGLGPNKVATDFTNGLLTAWSERQPSRFKRWSLGAVRWEEKGYGYIPYGDLLAYLPLGKYRSEVLSARFDYTALPGYVPCSFDLVELLERLDLLEQTRNVDDVLDAMDRLRGTQLGDIVIRDLKERLSRDSNLQLKLVEALEARYSQKLRNLDRLRYLLAQTRRCVSALPAQSGWRTRLLWTALEFQNANHDGDPERIHKSIADYRGWRTKAMEHDRELSASVDLNMAVHFADRFEFAEGWVTVESLRIDPLFPALSPLIRGGVYSSLGQYASISGQYEEAELCFKEALDLFDAADLTETARRGEKDQTGVYRAINAMDGQFEQMEDLAKAVVGPLDVAAKALGSSCDIARQYHHHLFLRLLNARPDLVDVRNIYLACQTNWADIPQHPWEFIAFYRGILLWERNEDKDSAAALGWFERSLDIATNLSHGATLQWIAAVLGTAAYCCLDADSLKKRAEQCAQNAVKALPHLSPRVETLAALLGNPGPDRRHEALALLPFNYR